MDDALVHTLRMSSPPDDVGTLHDLLESVWLDVPQLAVRDRFGFETALVELVGNVICHADNGSGVSCTLSIETADNRIEALLSDTGEPGDVELRGRDMPDGLSESGRGIPLIQALVDELTYERDGGLNRWRISKQLGA
ncbi:MAG: serine/threonine-protein kinase RsbW [Microbacteriaceae bacterium]|jgi:serine/threonine-protein kinase RsbW|nr:serine/threonine-protein kinase RsbW [Microbacteriaceae bacterium]